MPTDKRGNTSTGIFRNTFNGESNSRSKSCKYGEHMGNSDNFNFNWDFNLKFNPTSPSLQNPIRKGNGMRSKGKQKNFKTLSVEIVIRWLRDYQIETNKARYTFFSLDKNNF